MKNVGSTFFLTLASLFIVTVGISCVPRVFFFFFSFYARLTPYVLIFINQGGDEWEGKNIIVVITLREKLEILQNSVFARPPPQPSSPYFS